jgi:hypothetical protein
MLLSLRLTFADDYNWINPDGGQYEDMNNWGNTEHPNGPAGPPTANDNVNLGSGEYNVQVNKPTGAMTLSGNSGAQLYLTADYSAMNLADAVLISGIGTLTAQTVTGLAGPIVNGGFLNASSFTASTLRSTSFGHATINSITPTNFLGIATFMADNGGKITIPAATANVACDVSGTSAHETGGFIDVQGNLFNTRNASVSLDALPVFSSSLHVGGNFSVAGSFLDVTNGAVLTVDQNLHLFGGRSSSTGELSPGGGHWGEVGVNEPGTAINVANNIDLGGVGGPGMFFLSINDGVTVTCSQLRIGSGSSVTMSSGAQVNARIVQNKSLIQLDDTGVPGAVFVGSGGLAGGAGELDGNLTIGSGGRFNPGEELGQFTLQGNYAQQAGSTFYVEIGGTDSTSGYDNISTGGTATLGGTLRVRLVNGFTPTVGQIFSIINAGTVTGSFATISPPTQAGISIVNGGSFLQVKIDSVVAGAPVISSPTSAAAAPGAPFTYQVTATNNPVSYTATSLPSGLTLETSTGRISGMPKSAGTFIVPISANNAAGSGAADLTIHSDSSVGTVSFLNISTRLDVQTGDNVLIGGFIITGSNAKQVLVRGLGPSLADQGVTGALADPVIELHEPDGTVITNDNWQDTQKNEIIATTIPPSNSLESAIVATLQPGAYTVVLHGKGVGIGVGLVEAYDLDQTAASELANISTRGFVQSGDNVMIGGIIAGGQEGSSTIVVRGIGPSLGSMNVNNALQDPTLELHDSSGALIATNDDWQDTQESEIEMSGLAPIDDRESAIEATLAPGAYTAILRGKDNATGVGLVEAYNLL